MSDPTYSEGPGWLRCRSCHSAFDVTPHDFLIPWLQGKEHRCPQCGARLVLWGSIAEAVQDQFSTGLASFLGGKSVAFRVTLRRDEMTRIDLSEYGVQDDATILDVFYTSELGFTPVEWHANAPMRARDRHVIRLWPIPTDSVQEASCNVLVAWLPSATEDTSKSMMLDAAQRLRADDVDGALIRAHTALDVVLSRVVGQLSRVVMARTNPPRQSFLAKVATMQMVAAASRARPLPGHTISLLGELNRRRNDVAHPPEAQQGLDHAHVVELIAGAALACTYVEVLEALVREIADGAKPIVGAATSGPPE